MLNLHAAESLAKHGRRLEPWKREIVLLQVYVFDVADSLRQAEALRQDDQLVVRKVDHLSGAQLTAAADYPSLVCKPSFTLSSMRKATGESHVGTAGGTSKSGKAFSENISGST